LDRRALFDSRCEFEPGHDHHHPVALPARQGHRHPEALRHTVDLEEATRAVGAAKVEGEATGAWP